MSEIIAYKDQNNEYFDFEIENSKPIRAKSDDALNICLLYTSPSPRDKRQSRMPSSA